MILERYIYREIGEKLLWTLGLLILVFTNNKFIRFLNEVVEGRLPADFLLVMLGYKIVAILPRLLPFALLISILLAFIRFAKNRELVIFSLAGCGTDFQIKVIMRFALCYSLIVAAFTCYLSPLAEHRINQLKQVAHLQSDFSNLTPGVFKQLSQGNQVIYIESIATEKNELRNIFIQFNQGDKIGIINADRGKIITGHSNTFLELYDGNRYVGYPGQADYQITHYQTYKIKIYENTLLDSSTQGSRTIQQLLYSEKPEDQAEFHWQIGLVVSNLLIALFAVVLNPFLLKENSFLPLVIATVVLLIYSNLLGIGVTLIRRELIPSYSGLWWVHLLMIGVIYTIYSLFIQHQPKKQRTLSKIPL